MKKLSVELLCVVSRHKCLRSAEKINRFETTDSGETFGKLKNFVLYSIQVGKVDAGKKFTLDRSITNKNKHCDT